MTSWSGRAEARVAGFTSTRSKTPDALFGGPGGPTHMTLAQDCRVETADGRVLLDWTMALGAVSLGYAHPLVSEAVARAVRDGAVGPLPPRLEVRVAERLAESYPGAEQVRFFKTGAEAVQAAVRLARVVTGRDAVVHCGYHGWLDGPTSGAGVPSAVSGLWHAAAFNDVASLEAAVRAVRPAAIMLEPVIEEPPLPEWLQAARRLADETGSLLVFDEVKTAFRLSRGGGAQVYGVTPDLAVLGKALSNGFSLAALAGRGDCMSRLRETWVSSTLATEFVALAAADAVLDVWEQTDVAGHIETVGRMMLDDLRQLEAEPVWPQSRVEVAGIPAMWFLRWSEPEPERALLLACARRGVLLKRGAYNFPSLAHTGRDVRTTIGALRDALSEIAP